MQILSIFMAALGLAVLRVPERLPAPCENRALATKAAGPAATEWNRTLHYLDTVDPSLALLLGDLTWTSSAPESVYAAFHSGLLLLKEQQVRFSEPGYMPGAEGEQISDELAAKLRQQFRGRPYHLDSDRWTLEDLTRFYRNAIYQGIVFLDIGLREQLARDLLQRSGIAPTDSDTVLMLAKFLDRANLRPISAHQPGLSLASPELSLIEANALINNFRLPKEVEVIALEKGFRLHRSGRSGDAQGVLAAAGYSRNDQARIFQDWQHVERNLRCCMFTLGCPDCPRQRSFLQAP